MSTDSPNARSAIILFSLGILLFALNDALGKWLMAGYTAQQLIFVRSFGAGLVLAPLAWRNPWQIRVAGQYGMHLGRIACMFVDGASFYFATKFLPLADVMTFYLAAPLIVTALSVPFLGERVGPFRWTAVLVGFLGVVIVLHPTGAAWSGASVLALVGACAFACNIIMTRKLRDTHWLGLIFWQFLGTGLMGAALSPIGWVTPSPRDAGLMIIVGVLSMVAFIGITKALRQGDASVVAPFTYTSIVWAVLLGWLIWGDVPNRTTALGIAVIVASGLVVWWREKRRDVVAPAGAMP